MTIARILLLGVALGVVLTDQSNPGPFSEEQLDAGKGRVDTPAVVLQLKYDGGELNKIYLAQFRKGKGVWTPSVTVRANLCTDLCHAGRPRIFVSFAFVFFFGTNFFLNCCGLVAEIFVLCFCFGE